MTRALGLFLLPLLRFTLLCQVCFHQLTRYVGPLWKGVAKLSIGNKILHRSLHHQPTVKSAALPTGQQAPKFGRLRTRIAVNVLLPEVEKHRHRTPKPLLW